MTPQPKEQSHSALPWQLRNHGIDGAEYGHGIVHSHGGAHRFVYIKDVGELETCDMDIPKLEANAKLIIKAVNSHARLLAQNEMLRTALEQINGCYVGKFSGEVIGLKSNTALDEPCRIARAALEQMEKV